MKLHPDGTIEGTPAEMAEFRRLCAWPTIPVVLPLPVAPIEPWPQPWYPGTAAPPWTITCAGVTTNTTDAIAVRA